MSLFIGGSYKFEQNGVRLLDAYSGFFFYATGITPAMAMKMVGKGSAYAGAFVDAKGDRSTAASLQSTHAPEYSRQGILVLHLYDNQTRSMLQTDQQFPAVGSETTGIKVNAGQIGGCHFGPKAPAGQENNWIQTIPGKGFNVVLRLYGPLDSWFDKTWRPGDFESVN